MLYLLIEVFNSDGRLQITWLGLTVLLAFMSGGLFFSKVSLDNVSFPKSLKTRLTSWRERAAYQKVVKPYEGILGVTFSFLLTDIFALLLPEGDWSRLLEIPIGLALTISGSWLASQMFKEFFDPNSTNITLKNDSESQTTNARVTFFILGSSENSIQLRKRLLELANEKISKDLLSHGIKFKMQEPTIYVESPVII